MKNRNLIMALTGLIILIADRNPNIRSLISRELRSDGYDVRSARSATELLYHISGLSGHSVLLILDPDLPDAEYMSIERMLNERIPAIPIIIHALNPEFLNHDRFLYAKEIIEKADKSIESLKNAVSKVSSTFTHSIICDDMSQPAYKLEMQSEHKKP